MADLPISVFISYSRTDSAFIDRMEADLRAYGFDTWVDRQHLEGGTDWARLIEQEILTRETLVVSLSPDAVTSTWVRREITFALNAGKHVIPIIVRPVERVPIEIIEKQYIDLHGDYARGLQELRVALLKTRTLPAPPLAAHAPQPLLAIPDVSDPLKGLVTIPAPPPAPNPDLNAAFMQAQTSLAHDNLDLAEALLLQVVEQQSDFGYGLAAEELERVRKQLEPKQIESLRAMADDAWARGAWGQAIGALRALIERQPTDKSLPARLSQAEENQKWAWLYDNARAFAQSGDAAAARVALTQLWEKAPDFGDPAHIAPKSVTLPIENRVPPPSLPSVPIPSDQQPAFRVVEGLGKGQMYRISQVPYLVGGWSGGQVHLPLSGLTGLHAQVYRNRAGDFILQNMNGATDVYAKGKQISQPQVLANGDLIQVGKSVLRFDLPDDGKWRNIFRRFTS